MAKIVRNKPAPDQEAAIAAFGAAADTLPDDVPTPAAKGAPAPKNNSTGPASTLLRWEGNEDLRDAIIAYSKRERYPVHTVLLDAIRRGFEQVEG